MGNTTSQSDIKQENNQTIVNETVLNSLTQYINENMFDFKALNEQNCSSSSTQTQVINLTNITTTNDEGIVIKDNDFDQTVTLNIYCLSDQTIVNTVIQDIVNNVVSQMQKTFDNAVLSDLDAKIKQKTEGASLSFAPPPESNVNLDQIQNIKITNSVHQNITNMFKNVFATYFTIDNVQNCKTNLTQAQGFTLNNATTAKIVMTNNKFKQSQDIIRKCITSQNIASNVTNTIKNALTSNDIIKVDNSSATSSSSDVSQDTKAGDVFLNIGTAISGILASFGVVLSSYASLVCACACLCCCLLLIIGIIFMMMEDGENTETE